MDFGYLIWIIIILVYIASFILKRMRAASKTVEKGIAKGPPEWKVKLDKYLAQTRQEQEIAKQEDSGEETGWAQVLPKEDDMPALAMEETGAMAISPAPARKVTRERVVPGDLKPARKKISPKGLTYGIQDLRRAVIWSEILAPPLALRDK